MSEEHWAKFLEDAPSKEAQVQKHVKFTLENKGEDFLRGVLIDQKISGVGRVWAERIAAHFKTTKALQQASEEYLRQKFKLGPMATRALVDTVASQHEAIKAAVVQLAEKG